MSVYVDALRPCVPNPRWNWDRMCHLTADTLDELHTFAIRLGLKRDWLHHHPFMPHYDLTANKRAKAVRLGAVEINQREAGRRVHTARQARRAQGATPCAT